MTLATTRIDRAAVTGLIAHCSPVASVYRKRWDYYLQGTARGLFGVGTVGGRVKHVDSFQQLLLGVSNEQYLGWLPAAPLSSWPESSQMVEGREEQRVVGLNIATLGQQTSRWPAIGRFPAPRRTPVAVAIASAGRLAVPIADVYRAN